LITLLACNLKTGDGGETAAVVGGWLLMELVVLEIYAGSSRSNINRKAKANGVRIGTFILS
jgi:hypothetical protein